MTSVTPGGIGTIPYGAPPGSRRSFWSVNSVDSTTGGLRLAPADRAAGARGPRAKLAGAVAIVALPVLAMSSFDRDPGWTVFAFAAAAGMLVAAAVLLWIGRNTRVLVLAVVLIPLGVATAVAAEAERNRVQHEAEKWGGASYRFDAKGRILTREQAEAVPEGITTEELKARLGPAAGSGVQRVTGEPDMRCVAYRGNSAEFPPLFAFCIREGRYEALRQW